MTSTDKDYIQILQELRNAPFMTDKTIDAIDAGIRALERMEQNESEEE